MKISSWWKQFGWGAFGSLLGEVAKWYFWVNGTGLYPIAGSEKIYYFVMILFSACAGVFAAQSTGTNWFFGVYTGLTFPGFVSIFTPHH